MGILRRLAGVALLLTLCSEPIAPKTAKAQDDSRAAVISEPPQSTAPAAVPATSTPASEPEVRSSARGGATSGQQSREAANLDLATPKQPLGIWRFGGGLGFSFFNDYFFLTIEPQASYLIKRIVEPGATLVYQWSKDTLPDPNVVRHTVGGRLFARLYPIRQLFILVEGELLNSGVKQGEFSGDRKNYPNLFLGGGFLFGLGKGVFLSTGIKVNVFTSDLYPDHFPIFTLGAGFGF